VTQNPYAPPKAEVADPLPDGTWPTLWNPGAAANWSLLFSPAFGAFLHMKNWEALGEPGKASTAKTWIVLTLIVLAVGPVAAALLPDNKSIGRGWGKPILLAILALVGFLVYAVLITLLGSIFNHGV
jgi:cation transporter-like permease